MPSVNIPHNLGNRSFFEQRHTPFLHTSFSQLEALAPIQAFPSLLFEVCLALHHNQVCVNQASCGEPNLFPRI